MHNYSLIALIKLYIIYTLFSRFLNIFSYFAHINGMNLKDFFNSLSFQAQSHFLSYWLNKCYLKDKKYYDREKLVLLDKISDTDVFANLIFELNTEESRKRKTNPVKAEVM